MYVKRDEHSLIIGVFTSLQPGYAEELLDKNDAEISAFYERVDNGNS
jgi:hypothetical protein